jgi:hypothetical protein
VIVRRVTEARRLALVKPLDANPVGVISAAASPAGVTASNRTSIMNLTTKKDALKAVGAPSQPNRTSTNGSDPANDRTGPQPAHPTVSFSQTPTLASPSSRLSNANANANSNSSKSKTAKFAAIHPSVPSTPALSAAMTRQMLDEKTGYPPPPPSRRKGEHTRLDGRPTRRKSMMGRAAGGLAKLKCWT